MSLLCWRVRLPVDLVTRITDEKAKFKFQGTSGKCPFRFRINTVLRGVASNCYLLINLVMVVVAKSWAYGELPRSSRRWHFPKLSGLFCGKEIQGRHPQVSTGHFFKLNGLPTWKETRAFSASALAAASWLSYNSLHKASSLITSCEEKDIFNVAFTFLEFKALIPREASVGDGLPIASQCRELDKGTKNW